MNRTSSTAGITGPHAPGAQRGGTPGLGMPLPAGHIHIGNDLSRAEAMRPPRLWPITIVLDSPSADQADRGQRGQLVPPGLPELGEAVQQH